MSKSKMLKRVIKATKALLKNETTVTTLAVKYYLRGKYPGKRFTQQDVSSSLMTIHSNGMIKNLSFNDNGVYREYFILKPKKKNKKSAKGSNTLTSKIIKSNATKMSNLIQNSKGKFFTVSFIKADGTLRVLNGNAKSNCMTSLGYLLVNEAGGKGVRNVNPKQIRSLHINGELHVLK